MPTKTDGRPRHQQIAAQLRAQIMDGDLAGQLPYVRDLMQQFDVGSPTIQRALQVLKDEGFVTGRRGEGTFVQPHRPIVIDTAPYLAPEDGYSYKILNVEELRPPARVADALGLADDETAVVRHRLMYLRDVPVELSWSYYPMSIARGTRLADPRKIPGGAPRLLADLGFPQRPDWEDYYSSRLPTTTEIEQLELPDDATVLRQFRVVYTDERRPVEASILVKGGHLYELRSRH